MAIIARFLGIGDEHRTTEVRFLISHFTSYLTLLLRGQKIEKIFRKISCNSNGVFFCNGECRRKTLCV